AVWTSIFVSPSGVLAVSSPRVCTSLTVSTFFLPPKPSTTFANSAWPSFASPEAAVSGVAAGFGAGVGDCAAAARASAVMVRAARMCRRTFMVSPSGILLRSSMPAVPTSTDTLLARLEPARHLRPGARETERWLSQARRVRVGDAERLIRLHDAVMFLRAYPHSPRVRRLCEEILREFSKRVARLSEAD